MTSVIDHLAIEEIYDRMESGATEPYLCRLSDDHDYVVKGSAAFSHGLIAETICGALGRAFGLPVPGFAIAKIDPSLLALDRDAKRSLGSGHGFASRHRPHLIELGRGNAVDVDPAILRRLFLFDYWIRNADRTGSIYGGNSNLFMDIADRTPVVLDHNLAFDPAYDLRDLQHHICFDFWFDAPPGMFERDLFSEEMEDALVSIDHLETMLPDAWIEDEPDMLARIGGLLLEHRTDAFWEPLT